MLGVGHGLLEFLVNLPLPSVALSGLPQAASPKAAIGEAAAMGVRGVQLDAARLGFRPRELDRSARRDLAASLRREELALSGLDLWIPPHHFTETDRADRAIGATVAALELAAELAGLADGAPVVALTLPSDLDPGTRATLDAAAAGAGATLADHAWPAVGVSTEGAIKPGLDPAAVILAGGDPVSAAGAHGPDLASARVTDLSARGACPAGDRSGRLDLDAYLLSLAVAGTVRHAVIDPRGLAEPIEGVRLALERWPAGLTLPNS